MSRHRHPDPRQYASAVQSRRHLAFWCVLAAAIVLAGVLYIATTNRAQHTDDGYVSRYVPATTLTIAPSTPVTGGNSSVDERPQTSKTPRTTSADSSNRVSG